MFIDIDHIALSSVNFKEYIEIFGSLGYSQRFTETNIKNLEIKAGLMKQFNNWQDLALLACEGSISIELVNHGHIIAGNQNILPVFENMPEAFIEKCGEERLGDNIIIRSKIKNSNTAIFIQEETNNRNFIFNKMVIITKDIAKSIMFWQCLGFSLIDIGKSPALLEFKTLLTKRPYQIYLRQEEVNNCTPVFLDSCGFNCIAFISTSIDKDKKLLEQKGIGSTEIERIIIDHRALDIFFASSPCGEIAEVIGITNE